MRTKTLSTWEKAVIENTIAAKLLDEIEKQTGNQIYRDHLANLANLLLDAKKIVIHTAD